VRTSLVVQDEPGHLGALYPLSAVEPIRHTSDSHGQILALAFAARKPWTPFKLSPARSTAVPGSPVNRAWDGPG
jgi:hypothetical protein